MDELYGMTIDEAEGYLTERGFSVSIRSVTPDKQKHWDRMLVIGVNTDLNAMTAELVGCGFLCKPNDL